MANKPKAAPTPLTKQLAMRGKPKTPPDITYNPTSKNIPYSTRSATAAKNIAGAGGQKSYYNHR